MRFRRNHPFRWAVLNQSISPPFQELLEGLSASLGPCLLMTGTPVASPCEELTVWQGTPYDRRGIRRRATSWLRFALEAGTRFTTSSTAPFLLAVTNPPVLPQVAFALRALRGIRYGLLFWDIYPNHVVQAGLVGSSHPLVRSWAYLNERAMRDAEIVITLGDRMAEALRAQMGVRGQQIPIEVVPNWADTGLLRPMARSENPFAERHELGDRVVVLYSGNIGATHGLESLVKAAQRLVGRCEVVFVIIGDGLGRPGLERLLCDLRLPNVKLLEPLPWSELPAALASADLAVVAQSPGSEHLSVPSKTYSYLAAGGAILALTDSTSDLAALVSRESLGFVCNQADVNAICQAITMAVDGPDALRAMRGRARRIAVEQFDKHLIYSRMLELLTPLVKETDTVSSRYEEQTDR